MEGLNVQFRKTHTLSLISDETTILNYKSRNIIHKSFRQERWEVRERQQDLWSKELNCSKFSGHIHTFDKPSQTLIVKIEACKSIPSFQELYHRHYKLPANGKAGRNMYNQF